MKLVGVCACTSGIAHTYMAKEKLVKAAQALGHEIHVETQGTIGVEDPLTPEEIAEADAVMPVHRQIGFPHGRKTSPFGH